jgi:hypothetical protein
MIVYISLDERAVQFQVTIAMDHQASNAQSTNSKGDNSLPMSSRPTEAMLLTNSSTQTDLSPLFRFNPTTDPFQPGAVEKPGNSTTNSGDYFFAHDQSFDIPYTTETQYISQDLNIDMNMNIEHDVSMTYMPMDEPVIAMPTVESLDLSIQILWAEHQMRTQFLEG